MLKGPDRYAILYRSGAVKKAETRARKVAEFVAMMERGTRCGGEHASLELSRIYSLRRFRDERD